MRFPKILSAVLALTLLGVGFQTQSASPAKAAAESYFTFSASPTLRALDETTVLTGKFYRQGVLKKSGKINLQYQSGTKWVTARTLTIPASGTITTAVAPTVNRVYRLATIGNAVVSPTQSVKLRNGFIISPSATSINAGSTVKFTTRSFNKGKARTGKVQLQYYKNAKWNTLKSTTLVKGAAVVSHTPLFTMKWRFRDASSGAVTKASTVTLKPQLGISLSKKSLTAGDSLVLSASLKRDGKVVSSEKVTVQTATGSGWTNFKSVTVVSGKVTLTVKPPVSTKYRIKTSDGLYSSAKQVSVTPAPLKPTRWVDSGSNSLNVRTGAGREYASVTRLAHGSGVTLTGAERTRDAENLYWWREVKDQFGNTGWVADQFLTTKKPAKAFVFEGSGYGHGVGMSQYGAYAMASAGKSASQILTHYFTGTKVSTRSTQKNVSVKITGASRASGTEATIDAGSMRLRDAANTKTLSGAGSRSNAYKFTFKPSGGKVKASVVNKASGEVLATHTVDSLLLHWTGTDHYSPSGTKAVLTLAGSGNSYRHGYMRISNIDGKINVVNVLRLNDQYLYGISEMPSSWGAQGKAALEAQAIAARSYALSKGSGKKASCDCILVDTTTDQVFAGWTKENGSSGKYWRDAVNASFTSETSAKVLTYSDKPVGTHYYSYSGGKTANSEDVWTNGATTGGKIAHERSVDDPWSARANDVPGVWQHVVTEAQLLKTFTALDDIASIEVTATYVSGQARSIRAVSTSGKSQTVTRSDSGTSTVAGWRSLLKGRNSKISTGSVTSAPGTWITGVKANQ